MSYINRPIAVYGDEKSFIKRFINDLCSADTRIQRIVPEGIPSSYTGTEAQWNALSDAARLEYWIDYDATSVTGNPTYSLSLGGDNKLSLTRSSPSTGNSSGYVFSVCHGQNQLCTRTISFAQTAASKVTVCYRMWKTAVAANTGVLAVFIGGYTLSDAINGSGDEKINILVFSENGVSGISGASPSLAVSGGIFLDNNSVCVKTDRLPYTFRPEQPGRVELIKSKALLTSGTSDLSMTVSGMYDISSVPSGRIMRIENRNYFSLDPHTIMEV